MDAICRENDVAKNIIRRKPSLLFVTISIMVVSRKLKASDGRIFSKSLISSPGNWELGKRDKSEQEN